MNLVCSFVSEPGLVHELNEGPPSNVLHTASRKAVFTHSSGYVFTQPPKFGFHRVPETTHCIHRIILVQGWDESPVLDPGGTALARGGTIPNFHPERERDQMFS